MSGKREAKQQSESESSSGTESESELELPHEAGTRKELPIDLTKQGEEYRNPQLARVWDLENTKQLAEVKILPPALGETIMRQWVAAFYARDPVFRKYTPADKAEAQQHALRQLKYGMRGEKVCACSVSAFSNSFFLRSLFLCRSDTSSTACARTLLPLRALRLLLPRLLRRSRLRRAPASSALAAASGTRTPASRASFSSSARKGW